VPSAATQAATKVLSANYVKGSVTVSGTYVQVMDSATRASPMLAGLGADLTEENWIALPHLGPALARLVGEDLADMGNEEPWEMFCVLARLGHGRRSGNGVVLWVLDSRCKSCKTC
jgi:hypothetical protein